nr:TonB-dependent receptor [Sphingomonas sp. CDS-1]
MNIHAHASIVAMVSALLAGGTAYAQQGVNEAATAPSMEAPSASSNTESGLADIVVTANKQAQSLQRAPVAITAISSEQLVAQGVTDIRAAQAFVPSVRFQQQSAATEIYIRGVGATQDFPQFDPPTSTYFNGIYVPREATSAPLYDIAQIEVLPGPQGTLYGRSSLGGVVNASFNRPTNKQETRFLVEAGNYSLFHLTAVQNIPVTDTLAIRGAFDYHRHGAYQRSGAQTKDDWSGRLSLLYKPTDDLTAYLWGMVGDVNGKSATAIALGVRADGSLNPGGFIQNDPWNDLLPDSLLAVSPFGQPVPQETTYKNRIFGGEIDYNLSDSVTLTYIPSYLKFFVKTGYTLSGLPSVKTIGYEQTTHELRLAGKHDWGNWLLGAYGYRMTSDGVFYVASYDFSGFPVNIVDRNRIKGAAVFGQVTYNVTDALRVTAGGRYGADDRTGRGRYLTANGLDPFTFDKSYNRFDFKLGVDYDIAPRTMLYAAVQTGFQPGTFNNYADTATTSNRVNPAKLTAYTAGIKSRIFGDRLQINNEFFYYDYRGLFIAAYNALLQQTQVFNAQKVEIYGDQLDVVFKPTDNDQLNISVGYLHARNKNFTLPDGSATFDGLQLQFAPDWTVSAGYHHDFTLSNGYVRALVSGRFESSFYGDFRHTPGAFQPSYAKADASLTYYDDGGRWSLGAWIKNITNKAVIAATAAGSNFPLNGSGATGFIEDPRTYGIRATYNF